jgi:hypothetical protein
MEIVDGKSEDNHGVDQERRRKHRQGHRQGSTKIARPEIHSRFFNGTVHGFQGGQHAYINIGVVVQDKRIGHTKPAIE